MSRSVFNVFSGPLMGTHFLEMSPLSDDTKHRKQFFYDQKELKKRVGKQGASERAASLMINELQKDSGNKDERIR